MPGCGATAPCDAVWPAFAPLEPDPPELAPPPAKAGGDVLAKRTTIINAIFREAMFHTPV
jgi:hypothetical protein